MNDFRDGPKSTGYPSSRIFVQPVDQLEIVLTGLPKADTRVEDDP